MLNTDAITAHTLEGSDPLVPTNTAGALKTKFRFEKAIRNAIVGSITTAVFPRSPASSWSGPTSPSVASPDSHNRAVAYQRTGGREMSRAW